LTKPKESKILREMKEKTIEKQTTKRIEIERHKENVHSLANKKKMLLCEEILKKKPNIRILEINNTKLSNIKDINLIEEKWLLKIIDDIKSKEENASLRNIDRDIKIIDGCVRFNIESEFKNLTKEIPAKQEAVNNTLQEYSIKKSKEIESMNQIVQNVKDNLSIHIKAVEEKCKEIYDKKMKEYLSNKIPKLKKEILKKAKEKYEEFKKKQLEDKKKEDELKATEKAAAEEKAKRDEKRQWADNKNRDRDNRGENRGFGEWRTNKPLEVRKEPSPTKHENYSNTGGFQKGLYANKATFEEKKKFTYEKKSKDSFKDRDSKESNEGLGDFRKKNPPKETKNIEKAKPKKTEEDEEEDFKIVKSSKK